MGLCLIIIIIKRFGYSINLVEPYIVQQSKMASYILTEMFRTGTLKDKSGAVISPESLVNKPLALYFSVYAVLSC